MVKLRKGIVVALLALVAACLTGAAVIGGDNKSTAFAADTEQTEQGAIRINGTALYNLNGDPLSTEWRWVKGGNLGRTSSIVPTDKKFDDKGNIIPGETAVRDTANFVIRNVKTPDTDRMEFTISYGLVENSFQMIGLTIATGYDEGGFGGVTAISARYFILLKDLEVGSYTMRVTASAADNNDIKHVYTDFTILVEQERHIHDNNNNEMPLYGSYNAGWVKGKFDVAYPELEYFQPTYGDELHFVLRNTTGGAYTEVERFALKKVEGGVKAYSSGSDYVLGAAKSGNATDNEYLTELLNKLDYGTYQFLIHANRFTDSAAGITYADYECKYSLTVCYDTENTSDEIAQVFRHIETDGSNGLIPDGTITYKYGQATYAAIRAAHCNTVFLELSSVDSKSGKDEIVYTPIIHFALRYENGMFNAYNYDISLANLTLESVGDYIPNGSSLLLNTLNNLDVGSYRLRMVVPEHKGEGVHSHWWVGANDADYGKYYYDRDVQYRNTSRAINFVVEPAQINLRNVQVVASGDLVFDGTAKTPNVALYYKDTLIPSTAYSLSYSNNINAGTMTVTVTANAGGNFTGTFDIPAQIERANNTWTQDPVVMQWTYGRYDRFVNLITAVPEKNVNERGALVAGTALDVDYYLYEMRLVGTNYVRVPLYYVTDADGNPVYNKGQLQAKPFRLIRAEEGKAAEFIVPDDVAELLSGLHAGVYYLQASANVANCEPLLSGLVSFEVVAAANRWFEAPNVIRWTYGNYDKNVNLFRGLPEFGKQKADGTVDPSGVQFCVLTSKDFVAGVEPRVLFNPDGKDNDEKYMFNLVYSEEINDYVVPDYVAAVLNGLNAGTYYMIAVAPSSQMLYGTADFTGLNSTRADGTGAFVTPVEFRINASVNHWIVAPNLIRGTAGAYDKEVNLFSAQAAYGNETLRFSILTKNTYPYEYVMFNNPASGEQNYFMLESNGQVPDWVATKLNTLTYGTYYLVGTVLTDANGNYNGINDNLDDADAHPDMQQFTVFRSSNIWIDMPNVVRWYAGDYNKAENLFTGSAAHGTENLTYAILRNKTAPFSAVEFTDASGAKVTEFATDGNGQVPDWVATGLNALPAGTYYLLAKIPADPMRYDGKNDVDLSTATTADVSLVMFKIKQNINTWTKSPSIMSWVEGAYDASKNAITAQTAFGNDKLVVRVMGGNTEYYNSTSGLNKLSELKAGEYTLICSVQEDTNYTELLSEQKFRVFEKGSTTVNVGGGKGCGSYVSGYAAVAAMAVMALAFVAIRAAKRKNDR